MENFDDFIGTIAKAILKKGLKDIVGIIVST